MYKATFFITIPEMDRMEIGNVLIHHDNAYKALDQARDKADVIAKVLKTQFKWLRGKDIEILVQRYDPQLPLFEDLPPTTVEARNWTELQQPEPQPVLKTLNTNTAPKGVHRNPESPTMEEYYRNLPGYALVHVPQPQAHACCHGLFRPPTLNAPNGS